jgi:5-methylcytosine-specific restriction endonuclease McrA
MTNGNFNIDHIIPHSLGGTNYPYNYFILCGSINKSFNAWYTHEKVAYIGLPVVKRAKNFAGWVKRETQKKVDFSGYDPIREGALR